MPLYDYLCETCGPFEKICPISQCREDTECPMCGSRSPRVISVPRLSLLSDAARKAHETNERSRHEPKVSSGHSCCAGGTCAAHGGGKAAAKKKESEGKPLYKALKGERRPWMISH